MKPRCKACGIRQQQSGTGSRCVRCFNIANGIGHNGRRGIGDAARRAKAIAREHGQRQLDKQIALRVRRNGDDAPRVQPFHQVIRTAGTVVVPGTVAFSVLYGAR